MGVVRLFVWISLAFSYLTLFCSIMSKPYFSRILLKISGEALGGDHGGLDASAIFRSAQLIEESVRSGVIIGAGNLFRGLEGSRQGMERIGGDYAGMLATCMNALVMRDALQKLGLKAEIQSSLPIAGVLPPFDYREAQRMLDEGTVVLFSAGTGHPFFSTDTPRCARSRSRPRQSSRPQRSTASTRRTPSQIPMQRDSSALPTTRH